MLCAELYRLFYLQTGGLVGECEVIAPVSIEQLLVTIQLLIAQIYQVRALSTAYSSAA